MNPTPNQITECDDEKVLCEWAAVYCMGWTKGFNDALGYVYAVGKYSHITCDAYQPTSPTDIGKSQCWGLVYEYGIEISQVSERDMAGCDIRIGEAYIQYHKKPIIQELQIAVVKAALLSAIGE